MTNPFLDSIIIFLVVFVFLQYHLCLFFLGSVWQGSPVAGSPPSCSVAFSSIIESQEIENTTLERYR